MSQVRTTEIRALDGTETTEVNIPSLDKKMASAWVRFNGVGSVAVVDSFNVSSITDLGTGLYRVNYSNPLSNSNYAVFCSNSAGFCNVGSITTSSVQATSRNTSGAPVDSSVVTVSVFAN